MPRCALSIVADSGWRTASLGLGGNIGDPRAAMAEALRQLDGRSDCEVVAVSRLYKTPPWGKIDQADFFNCCALVRTTLEPEALLEACLDIERGMKRERIERWGPRTIDIDILTYEGHRSEGDRLELPHPRMTQRGFVLMPLADIGASLNVEGRTVAEWLESAETAGIELVSDDREWWREA